MRTDRPVEEVLGCDVASFAKWIERQWEPWMSWDNFGIRSNQWTLHCVVEPAGDDKFLGYWNFSPIDRTRTKLEILAVVCCAARQTV